MKFGKNNRKTFLAPLKLSTPLLAALLAAGTHHRPSAEFEEVKRDSGGIRPCGSPCPSEACTPASKRSRLGACASANPSLTHLRLIYVPEIGPIRALNAEFQPIEFTPSCVGAGLADIRIKFPFRYLSGFFPPDPVTIWNGKRDRWRRNTGDFARNETLEVAIGRGIRAKKGDAEYALHPGVVAENGSIEAKLGWRLHRDNSWPTPDHMDGNFKFTMTLAVEAGIVKANVNQAAMWWNPPGGRLGVPFSAAVSTIGSFRLEHELRTNGGVRIEEAIQRALNAYLLGLGQISKIVEYVNIGIEGADIVITVKSPFPACP